MHPIRENCRLLRHSASACPGPRQQRQQQHVRYNYPLPASGCKSPFGQSEKAAGCPGTQPVPEAWPKLRRTDNPLPLFLPRPAARLAESGRPSALRAAVACMQRQHWLIRGVNASCCRLRGNNCVPPAGIVPAGFPRSRRVAHAQPVTGQSRCFGKSHLVGQPERRSHRLLAGERNLRAAAVRAHRGQSPQIQRGCPVMGIAASRLQNPG